MPYSNGVYTLPAGNPVVTATAITIAWANNTLSDIATALSTCVLTDGTSGNMGVNTAKNVSIGIFESSTALTGTTQYGILSSTIGSSAATVAIYGLAGNPTTAASAYTATTVACFYATDATKGAGSTITTKVGLLIADQTQGAANYGIRGLVSAGNGKFNLYLEGTASNTMAGALYPAQDSKAIQSTCAIYAGTGVPNNANGNNGDFYFRGDTPGTGNQRLYIRAAGAWVALTL